MMPGLTLPSPTFAAPSVLHEVVIPSIKALNLPRNGVLSPCVKIKGKRPLGRCRQRGPSRPQGNRACDSDSWKSRRRKYGPEGEARAKCCLLFKPPSEEDLPPKVENGARPCSAC